MNRRSALFVGVGLCATPLCARAASVIRFATAPSESGALVDFAQSQGELRRAGVDVDVQYLSNGAASIAALVGGEIDVTGSNMLSVIQARERGVSIRIIAPQAVYRRGQASTLLLCQGDAPFRDGRDLDGKTVAVNAIGGSPHVAVEAWIDQNGGNASSVKYLEMTFSAMAPALAERRVDAAIVNEPALTNALGSGARILGDAYGAIAPYWLTDCLVATESWIAAHGDDARRFATALHRTAIWANRNREQTAPVVARLLKLDLATVQRMHRAVFAEQLTPAMIAPVIAAGLRYGAIATPIDAADLISPAVRT